MTRKTSAAPKSLEDADAILVYADELMERGDPHGTLIVLQHGKKTKQANAWLARHAPQILGPLAASNRTRLTWSTGFIRAAHLAEHGDGMSLVAQYDALRACPAAALITELSLDQAPMGVRCKSEQGYCYEALFARMAKHPLPSLQELWVGYEVTLPEYNCALGLGPMLARHPRLEKLGVSGGVYNLGSPNLPHLRTLRISADHHARSIRALAQASLPALVELDLHGAAHDDDAPTAEDYAKLFATSKMPALRQLVFATDDDTFPEAVRALLASRLLSRLAELELSFIDNTIADLVLGSAASLQHLAQLRLTTLSRNQVSAARRKLLAKALPNLRS